MFKTVQNVTRFVVSLPMMLVVAMLPLAGTCTTNITGHIVLTDDADWRGLGLVALDQGATINVNEHTLRVDGLTAQFVTGEDVTSSSGVVASSAIFSGSAQFLFDDRFEYTGNYAEHGNPEKNHRVCVQNVNAGNPFGVIYDFGEGNEKCLRAYRIYHDSQSPNLNGERAPRDWTFSGSNDNENWIVLDKRVNETEWTMPDVRTFSFYNQSAYRYYRLLVTASVDGDIMEMYQLEFFLGAAGYAVPADQTVPDPARVSSSALAGGSATNLFDNNFKHSMQHRLLANAFPCDVVYDFGIGNETVLNGYKIYYQANNHPDDGNGRAPFNWRFEGSNDKSSWTPLDIREGETNWTSGVAREFWFANGSPWRYYRLQVTKVGHVGYLELFQLEYFCRSAVCSRTNLEDVDLTEPGSEHVSKSSTKLTGGSVEALFDNDFQRSEAHRLLIYKDQLPFDLVYDFGEGKSANVTSYRIYCHSSQLGRRPQLWTFAGSNTGGTSQSEWTALDSRDASTQWPDWPDPCMRTFSFDNRDSYRYYRLQFKRPESGENDYLELYQLEFFHEKAGTLQIDIPAGTALTNSYVALDGALRFVKDGVGNFTADFSNQTYRGGTVISNGTLVAGLAGGAAPLGEPNGTTSGASSVTICVGGVFDAAGLGGWWNYPFRLDGGILRCAMPETEAPTDTFRHIALDTDSRLDVAGSFVMGDGSGMEGCLDLGGHVLTTSVSANGLWTLDLPSVTAGTIAFDLKKTDAWIGKKVMAWDAYAPAADVRIRMAVCGDRAVRAMPDGVYVISNGTIVFVR